MYFRLLFIHWFFHTTYGIGSSPEPAIFNCQYHPVFAHRVLISNKNRIYFVNIKLFVSSWANTESHFQQQ